MVQKPDDPELRVEIDPLDLHGEWANQPRQVLRWASRAAKAEKAYDDARSHLKLVYAELDGQIRANPAAFGIGKLTDERVKHRVIADPLHVAGQQAVNDARLRLGMCEAAVSALMDRKKALAYLTELWLREFNSDQSRPYRRRREADDDFDVEDRHDDYDGDDGSVR